MMADMFSDILKAIRSHLAEQQGVQDYLGVTTSADAEKLIYLYEFPLDDNGNPVHKGQFLMLDRGQNWSMTRERINSPAGRHFSKSGTVDMYWRYPIDGESPESEASESILSTAWALVAGLMDSLDDAPRINYTPAAILFNQIDLTEWWRPTADDAQTEGDRLEGVFTMMYGTGA